MQSLLNFKGFSEQFSYFLYIFIQLSLIVKYWNLTEIMFYYTTLISSISQDTRSFHLQYAYFEVAYV